MLNHVFCILTKTKIGYLRKRLQLAVVVALFIYLLELLTKCEIILFFSALQLLAE